ncbi:MAG: hypothetical protein AAF705_15880 [Bacteroidota bacterium]
MEEILDQEPQNKSKVLRKIKAILYLLIMLIGGIFIIKYTFITGDRATFWILFQAALIFEIAVILLSLVLKSIPLIWRKNKRISVKLFFLNFWFKYIEDGFAIWIIFMILVYLGRI